MNVVDLDSSGYVWRKYGEKTVGVRKQAVRRSYYRCVGLNSHTPCSAKKRIDRLVSADPSDPPLNVCLVNKHNHPPKRGAAGLAHADEADAEGDWSWEEEESSDSKLGLERLRAEDLAQEMYSDLMVQMEEEKELGAACWSNESAAGLRGDGAVAGARCASEAEEMLQALFVGTVREQEGAGVQYAARQENIRAMGAQFGSRELLACIEPLRTTSMASALTELLEMPHREGASGCSPPHERRTGAMSNALSSTLPRLSDSRPAEKAPGFLRRQGASLDSGALGHCKREGAGIHGFAFDDLVSLLKHELTSRTGVALGSTRVLQ